MNVDDTEAEIMFEKQQPEDREVHRVILKENTAAKTCRRFFQQREDVDEVETSY